VIAAFEREFILRLLAGNNGSIVRSAREAGLNRKNFSLKMKKYGISPPYGPG
jgi:DNA-binding NtrC family response regulator